MPAGNYNIACEQGATFALSIEWRDSTGALVDLSGRTARMQVRASKSASTTVLELTTENGRIALTTSIALSISATTTAALTPGAYVYDLEVVNGAEVVRLLEGSFVVSGEVTR